MKKKVIINGEETHYSIFDDGRLVNDLNNHFLKGSIRNGYHYYQLTGKGWKKNFSAHRLVAEAFLENPNNFPVVHHKDGDELNNFVSNLEWVSHSKNAKEVIRKVPRTNKRPKYEYYQGEIVKDEEWAQYRDTNYYISNYGRLWNRENNRILKKHEGRGGYLYFTITINKKTTKLMAHRAVYESFNNIILDSEEQIDHINADRQDNRLCNLQLVSAQKNCYLRSERLKENNDYLIHQMTLNNEVIMTYASMADAARAINVSIGSISSCVNGKCKTIKGFKWEKVKKE